MFKENDIVYAEICNETVRVTEDQVADEDYFSGVVLSSDDSSHPYGYNSSSFYAPYFVLKQESNEQELW